jgi:DNA mismatch repair protein MutL
MIAGCPEGTTMIVRDLFYNTPARLKFMKTDRAEGAGVSAQVVICALSHPEVSVRYIKDGKEECHTPGDGRMDSCIYNIFGREFASGLLFARTSDGEVATEGYVSAPAFARGNRSYQFFFVNGRYVKSKTLQAALEQAYKNTLFTGRYPSCVLYIKLKPSQVDVNVHPTKIEVKFLNEHQVFDSVYYAALSALENERGRAEVKLSEGTKIVFHNKQSGAGYEELPRSYGSGGVSARINPRQETGGYRLVCDETKAYYKAKDDRSETTGAYTQQRISEEAPEKEILKAVIPHEDIAGVRKNEIPYRFIGEALGTYILVEKGDSLWLIDKHAAHERIQFDSLKKRKKAALPQMLVHPIVIEPGQEETALLLENTGIFEELGLSIEAFGESSIAVREIPTELDFDDVESVLDETARILRRGGVPDKGLIFDELLKTVACKAAIKAGRRSEPGELNSLIDSVLSGEVRYCPHGRPVAIELSKTSLDKHFKRI